MPINGKSGVFVDMSRREVVDKDVDNVNNSSHILLKINYGQLLDLLFCPKMLGYPDGRTA